MMPFVAVAGVVVVADGAVCFRPRKARLLPAEKCRKKYMYLFSYVTARDLACVFMARFFLSKF